MFAWKPELEGKKVRCGCGNVFVVEAVAVAEEVPDEYGLAEEVTTAPRPAAVETPKPVLAYQGKEVAKPEAAREMERASTIRNLYVPLALALAGIGLRVGQVFFPGASSHGVWVAMGAVALAMVVNVLLMMVGVVAAARWVDADFGPWQTAWVKLTAMSLLAGGAAGAIVSLDWAQQGMQGPILALHVLILIYFIMFKMLFELDVQETLFTVVIVTALQTGAFCVVFSRLK
jgi:hypothetical protein